MIRMVLQLAGAAAALQEKRRFTALRARAASELGWSDVALLLFCALSFGIVLGMSFTGFFRRHFLALTAGFTAALGTRAVRWGFFSLPGRTPRS
jgi:hypothetical protein